MLWRRIWQAVQWRYGIIRVVAHCLRLLQSWRFSFSCKAPLRVCWLHHFSSRMFSQQIFQFRQEHLAICSPLRVKERLPLPKQCLCAGSSEQSVLHSMQHYVRDIYVEEIQWSNFDFESQQLSIFLQVKMSCTQLVLSSALYWQSKLCISRNLVCKLLGLLKAI